LPQKRPAKAARSSAVATPRPLSKAQATEQLVGDLADMLTTYNGILWKIRDAQTIALIARVAAGNITLIAGLRTPR